MIRDFDEFGAQPPRGPGAFRRPAVDERALMIFEYNHGEALQLVYQAKRVFWSHDPKVGLELVWDNLRRAERYPALVHSCVILYSLRILSRFGPIKRSLQVARQGLELAPSRGRNAFFNGAIHGEMTHLYHRLGDHEKVLHHGLLTLAEGQRHKHDGLRATGMFRYSQQLLRIGKPGIAVDYAKEAFQICMRQQASWPPPAYLVLLNLAQISEALGRKQEAHADYRRVTDHLGQHGYATRAEHETAGDGYHRTKH